MRSGENREIGFLINQLANPVSAEVIGGVVDLLEAEGYLVSVLDTRDDATRQGRHLDSFIRHGRGGLLWVPAIDTPDEIFNMLAKHAIPTVTFLRRVNDRIDHVGIRNAEATATATAYLADLGHRRIAYLGGFDDVQDAAVATPPLTTMAVSPHRLGRKLARVLLDRIQGPEMPVTVSEVSAELVVRETTAAPLFRIRTHSQ